MSQTNTKTKSLIFVHGHHCKPDKEALTSVWLDALRWGIERDHPEKTAVFDATRTEMAYFGDINNTFLSGNDVAYDERLDIADRRNACAALKKIPKRKKFSRYEYQQLPGKTALKEFLAGVGSPLLGRLGLEGPAIGKLLPELIEYWKADSEYSLAVRDRIRTTLTDTMNLSDEIMLVAHGMGAIVAYDALWELSRSMPEHKVDVLMTLGCPLGNRTVQKKLAGHGQSRAERYPSNILTWKNIAAEDDYICHDNTVADDFKAMLSLRLISSINDYRIYNMAVRYGKSHPHSSLDYLIHPRVSSLVSEWL